MKHVTKSGALKVSHEFTLPPTGQACLDRIVTDLGVFDVHEGRVKLVELAPVVEVDHVRRNTGAPVTSQVRASKTKEKPQTRLSAFNI